MNDVLVVGGGVAGLTAGALLAHQSLAAAGDQLFQAIYFGSPTEVRDPATVEHAKQQLLRAVERAFAGATGRPVLRRFMVHRMLTSAFHRAGQSYEQKVPLTVSGVDGLYLCGDGAAVLGELSNAAVISAEQVAELAARAMERAV